LWSKKSRRALADAVAAVARNWTMNPNFMSKDFLEKNFPWVDDSHLSFWPQCGTFPWNSHQERCLRHTFRSDGDRPPLMVQGFTWGTVTMWQNSAPEHQHNIGFKRSPEEGFQNLVTWLWNREHIWNHLVSVAAVGQDHWRAHGVQVESLAPQDPEIGFWWRLSFSHTQDKETIESNKRVVGFHGTSLYCLHRICRQGMANGWSENKEGTSTASGVFYMDGGQAHCCTTYMLYNELVSDGWLFAPLLELSVDRQAAVASGMKCTLKRTQPQRICDQKHCLVNAVYIHQVHIMEMIASEAAWFYNVEPGFSFLLELDPDESMETITERSRTSAPRGSEPQ
jgi:hypothetical protein